MQILYIDAIFLCILLHIGEGISLFRQTEQLVTKAGFNASLSCVASNNTFVLHLEWYCKECKLAGHGSEEAKLVEYTPESTTLFHHEGRLSLDQSTFDLTFRPVLAVDSGIYDCVVNNQLRTKVNLLVQDVPDPPGKPLFLRFNSRSVNLSWTKPLSSHHSALTHYIIHVREGEDGYWDVENGRATFSDSTDFNVEHLTPFTVYAFRVVAVNAIGQSLPSQESFFMITLREKPEGKPIFTSSSNASTTSIRVFWKPPLVASIHGEFLGYNLSIRARNEPKTEERTYDIRDPKRTSYTIKNLMPFTEYLLSLMVVNPEGSGPASTISVKTDEGVPGPPENLTVIQVVDTSVDLTWIKPSNPNGEIRGYRIYYKKENFTHVRTHHGDELLTAFSLTKLEPNSKFQIWTKAFTRTNEGNSSDPVFVETDVSGPDAPMIANLTCQSDTSLYLHWLRPAVVYGSVHLYYIYFRPEDSFNFQEIAVNSVNNRIEHNFLLSNLTVNTMYEVKVRGGTYSRFYDQNNLTYKGPFSEARKILLFPDCHKTAATEFQKIPFELSSDVVAGIFLAGFTLILLVIAVVIWRRFFHGSYYYLDDPPKTAQLLDQDWENDTGADGTFGSIPVAEFAKHVHDLHADGDIGFSKEYEAIQACSAQQTLPADQSTLPENKQKNRYLNIVAYDHSKVPLRPLPGHKKSSEYINANFIDGYDKPRAYIGTQGPLPSTFDTYWRMIWEQRVYIVVMITNLVERGRETIKKQPKLATQCLERKCDQYWPKDTTEVYGFIQVRLVHEEVMATYTVRKFAIKHLKVKCKKATGGERFVYQYHYTSWPDHGTPDHPLPVLSFVRKSAAANPEDAGPIIVHCSAGVGRTGTYIVLDAMLQQIRRKGLMNIWTFLKHIRNQRNYLVQTEEQYIFIHDALLEAIQCGDTCIPTNGISKYLKILQDSGGNPESPQPYFLLHHLFRLITFIHPQDYNIVSALKVENNDKNRSTCILPMENGRMHLTPKPGVDGSDYINATWLQGFRSLKEFILTQHPLTNTILDFWQMIWDSDAQTVVILTAVDEEHGFAQIWPQQGEDFDAENWKVHFIEENLHSGLSTIELIVQSTQDDHELPVRLIYAPGWPVTLPALATPLSLVSLVHEMTTSCLHAPVVVVDRYGGTEGATFCCFSTLKKQTEYAHQLDPYMYCKLYNKLRPSLWQTPDDIYRIYTVMESYLASENHSTGSCNSLAGFADPIIQLPQVTHLESIGLCLPKVNKVLSHEDVKIAHCASPPTLPTSLSLSSSVTNSPNIVASPQAVCDLAISSQIYSPNAPPSFADNGNIRVPPEGMEDVTTGFQIV